MNKAYCILINMLYLLMILIVCNACAVILSFPSKNFNFVIFLCSFVVGALIKGQQLILKKNFYSNIAQTILYFLLLILVIVLSPHSAIGTLLLKKTNYELPFISANPFLFMYITCIGLSLLLNVLHCQWKICISLKHYLFIQTLCVFICVLVLDPIFHSFIIFLTLIPTTMIPIIYALTGIILFVFNLLSEKMKTIYYKTDMAIILILTLYCVLTFCLFYLKQPSFFNELPLYREHVFLYCGTSAALLGYKWMQLFQEAPFLTENGAS